MRKKRAKRTEKNTEKKEIIPSPFGAQPPELNERESVNLEELNEDSLEQDLVGENVFKAIVGIPGLTAKMKFNIRESVLSNYQKKNKDEVITQACSLIGNNPARMKIVKKALEGAL